MIDRRAAVLAVCTFLLPLNVWAAPDRVERQRRESLRAAAAREVATLGGQATWAAFRVRPLAIRGLTLTTTGTSDQQRARSFLERYPGLFGGEGTVMHLRDIQTTRSVRIVRFEQRHDGLPVFGAQVLVTLDRHHRVRSVSLDLEPIQLKTNRPQLSALAAARVACLEATGRLDDNVSPSWARLGVMARGTARLVYRVALPLTLDRQVRWHLVDARTGKYIGWRRAAVSHARQEVR